MWQEIESILKQILLLDDDLALKMWWNIQLILIFWDAVQILDL